MTVQRPAPAPRSVVSSLVALGTAAAVSLAAAPAAAQVGHLPQESPFEDIEFRQGIDVFAGWWRAGKDPAGVAPQSGPMLGVRYDLLLGGPAYLTTRLGTIASERTVLDPARPAGDRVIGTEKRPMTFFDLGITTALTGQKTWHQLQPLLHVGAGGITNFKGEDLGGFKVGTSFAFAYGAGVKWVPGGRLAYRADVGGQLYRVRYPDRYFTEGLDGTSVLPADDGRSSWINNLTVTFGVTYQFRR